VTKLTKIIGLNKMKVTYSQWKTVTYVKPTLSLIIHSWSDTSS